MKLSIAVAVVGTSALIATGVAASPSNAAAADGLSPRGVATISIQSQVAVSATGKQTGTLLVSTAIAGQNIKIYRKLTKRSKGTLIAKGKTKALSTAPPGSLGLCIVLLPSSINSGYVYATNSSGARTSTVKIKPVSRKTQRGDVIVIKPKPLLACKPLDSV